MFDRTVKRAAGLKVAPMFPVGSVAQARSARVVEVVVAASVTPPTPSTQDPAPRTQNSALRHSRSIQTSTYRTGGGTSEVRTPRTFGLLRRKKRSWKRGA